jgi:sigma-B regulation protein RsbU (phosphoserine phosphatase)
MALAKTSSFRTKQRVRFRERGELLNFLLEVAAVTESLDLDEVLSGVAEIVRRVIPYDYFAIFLNNEKQKELRMRYAIGHPDEMVQTLVVRHGMGLVGTAADGREPVLVPDTRQDSRYLNLNDTVRSELSVPMIARRRVVGVLDVQATRAGTFTEGDRTMLRLIAGRVAAAIDNARLHRRTDRQYRTIRTLTAISQELSAILDLDRLLGRVASSVRSLISYDAFSILMIDEARQLLRHRFSMRYDQRVDLDNIPLGKGITGAAAMSRQTVRVDNTTADPRYIASHPGIRSELALPLSVQDRVIGVLNLESERPGYFTEEHAKTMELLAPSVAVAIENARLYEELGRREKAMQDDLNAAFRLQKVLLPQEAPEVEGLEIAIGLRPARQISGDLYDFFDYNDSHVQIAFGDSSGKGSAAALYGAMVNGLMRSLAPRRRNPAELMKAINDRLVEWSVEGRYVALMLMLWHPHSSSFTIANAGASLPMILREGEIHKMEVEGVPLGLLPDREYDQRHFHCNPGDVVVLFSDGVTDHLSESGKEYGRHGIMEVMRRASGLAPAVIIREIFADLDRFNTDRFDDQTLIVMRVK